MKIDQSLLNVGSRITKERTGYESTCACGHVMWKVFRSPIVSGLGYCIWRQKSADVTNISLLMVIMWMANNLVFIVKSIVRPWIDSALYVGQVTVRILPSMPKPFRIPPSLLWSFKVVAEYLQWGRMGVMLVCIC